MKPTEKEIKIALVLIERLLSIGLKDELACNDINWVDDHKKELYDMGISYNYGSTKLCLIYDALDRWVIKLSYDRSYDIAYSESGCAIDFCMREADNYASAVQKGLGRFFAATYLVGEVQGTKVFLQEKLHTDEDYFDEYFTDYVEDRFDINDYEDDSDYFDDIQDAAYQLDDEQRIEAVFGDSASFEELCALNDFINDYDINDLHCQNYGYDDNQNNKIIDFSGYSCS